jgi:hypothetical protein
MLSKRVVVVLSCLFALLWIGSPVAVGQSSSTGTITGTVTDSSGATVPGATVYLADTASGGIRPTTTSDKGLYIFPYVNPGTYSVKVSKQGFKTIVVSDQVVQVGTQLTVNAVLEVGSVSMVVEVTTSTGSELQTMDATVGANLSGDTLINLPNQSRDASTLAVLQPGQNINGNVGGNASDQNSFQLDGGYATDDMSGDNNTYIKGFGADTAGGTGAYHSAGFGQTPSAVVPIPVTSVEEFKVSTANQTADFSGGAGSQVQIVTKRGTNALHGGVYEYYLDTNFGGANTFDNNSTSTAQPSAHFNRFGADAGGKIPHSNFLGGDWYIFGNYEGFRNPTSATFERNFPTAALRAGLLQLNGEVVNLNPVPTVFPGTSTTYAANSATCVSASGCNKGAIPQGTVIPCTGAGGCDPRGMGINPVISTLWNTYLPMPGDCGHGDGLNYCGYKGVIATPQSSNFGVARIDHDFAKGWHFNGTYHYYKLSNVVSDQWDVGGFFPGDTKGQYAAIRQKPQNSWIYTFGLTKDIKPGLTNDFHFSYTRNWWAYGDPSGVPNVAGYPAALEIGGENSGAGSSPVFIPYNTNNQNVRTRYWNGHDTMYRDDLTWIKGSHLIQFGGLYQRNNDTHKRNDNGGSINTYEQYLIGEGNSVGLGSLGISLCGTPATCYVPAGITGNKYGNLYSMVLGMVDSTQGLFTRGLSTPAGLPLNPSTSCAISGVAATAGCTSSPAVLADSILPTYSIYWTDSWRVKPKFTLNYGIGYTVEMPPYETTGGFQTVLVDQNDHIVSAEQYFNNVKQAALQGQAYGPALGFATIRNVQGSNKYPYNPFYGGVSPRIGAAWNFTRDTVLRAGYARIFGRINGVNPLLVPLLTPGLLQPTTCGGPGAPSIVGNNTTCGGTTPANVFRVGVDCPAGSCVAPLPPPSKNLPQPWFPGVNDVATGAGETFDSNFKPNQSDEFSVTIQHQFGPKILAEAGYIGRKITHEVEYYSFTSVPYMMTLGGQSFANAWKNVMVATNYGSNVPPAKISGVANPAYLAYLNSIQVQPFFESALTKGYCGSVAGTTSCTAAFVAKSLGNMGVSDAFDAWGDVSNNGGFTFGRTFTSDPINSPFGANGQSPSLATTVSNGYGNYNAAFLQLTFTNWHGLTMKSNFTWSKALGTGNVVQASSSFSTVDPFNIHNNYGLQSYDEKFNLNIFFNYAPPFFSSQKGVLGRVLGGWNFSPLFVYGSGFPVQVQTPNGNCGTLGECNTAYVGANENMIIGNNLSYSATRKQNIAGSNGCGTAGKGQNVLSNPEASCPVNGGTFDDPVRAPILGLDGQIGGFPVRGLPLWNLDLGISKRIRVTERFSSSLHFDFANVLNHMQAADPCFNPSDISNWGVLGGCGNGNVQANIPRRMQLGLTIDW